MKSTGNGQERLRAELLSYLQREHAHVALSEAVSGFPKKLINRAPGGLPYSFWQLLEHIRITQHDMVEFISNPDYGELDWPEDYWPDSKLSATPRMWDQTLTGYRRDLATLRRIVGKPETDLLQPLPQGEGQTILTEVLQIIDHASYHTGEFVLMMRLLGIWRR